MTLLLIRCEPTDSPLEGGMKRQKERPSHRRAISSCTLGNASSVRPADDLEVCSWIAKSLAYSQATYGGSIWSVVLLSPCPSGDPLLHQSIRSMSLANFHWSERRKLFLSTLEG